MSIAENKKLVEEFVACYNERKLMPEWDNFIHNDAIFHEKPLDMTSAQSKEFTEQLMNAFPDHKMEIINLIAEDDTVVLHMAESGTMKGTFMGIEPTGKQFSIEAIEIYKIRDGKLAESWAARDKSVLMEQLGVTMSMEA